MLDSRLCAEKSFSPVLMLSTLSDLQILNLILLTIALIPGSRSRSKTAQDMGGLSGFPVRFERFERFGRLFLEKPLKPLKSCLKNRSKTAHFLW